MGPAFAAKRATHHPGEATPAAAAKGLARPLCAEERAGAKTHLQLTSCGLGLNYLTTTSKRELSKNRTGTAGVPHLTFASCIPQTLQPALLLASHCCSAALGSYCLPTALFLPLAFERWAAPTKHSAHQCALRALPILYIAAEQL